METTRSANLNWKKQKRMSAYRKRLGAQLTRFMSILKKQKEWPDRKHKSIPVQMDG